MDFEDLTRQIVTASRIAFSDMLERHKGEKFYALCLYTDNDCYTVDLLANTNESYKKKVMKEGVTDAKNMAAYRWHIGEWTIDSSSDCGFNEICKSLSKACQAACQNDSFDEFKKHAQSAMISAISILDKEGVFGQIRNDTILLVSSSEYEESEELENRSAKILNPPAMYEKFLNRWNV
jgi:hypothetical protein